MNGGEGLQRVGPDAGQVTPDDMFNLITDMAP